MGQTSGRDETSEERADRNWDELLQELRVSQTGVQLIAGFLMTLPFQSRFAELDTFQQRWYLGLIALSCLTIGLTLTPVAIHRRLFRSHAKESLVRAGHRITVLALAAIGLLLSGIVFLVVDVVVDRTFAAVAGLLAALALGVLLVGVPRLVDGSDD
jgi:drug/metabolite transporter (DMT)-like permease